MSQDEQQLAQALLRATQEREKACWEALVQVLREYRCRVEPRVVIEGASVVAAEVVIRALPWREEADTE